MAALWHREERGWERPGGSRGGTQFSPSTPHPVPPAVPPFQQRNTLRSREENTHIREETSMARVGFLTDGAERRSGRRGGRLCAGLPPRRRVERRLGTRFYAPCVVGPRRPLAAQGEAPSEPAARLVSGKGFPPRHLKSGQLMGSPERPPTSRYRTVRFCTASQRLRVRFRTHPYAAHQHLKG